MLCEQDPVILGYPTPPGAYRGRSLEELAEAVAKRTTHGINLARQGLCPRCWGDTTAEIKPNNEQETPFEYKTVVSCNRCWYGLEPPLQILIASMPSARAFYKEHGTVLVAYFLARTRLSDQTEHR
ncbi:DUF7351 domain-containing protein [Halovenus rubra]|uniref:DUF7351 domain-containing protein n=1 Tax=Halovenus rubra TaxID=869890 RepID=UPI003F63FF89